MHHKTHWKRNFPSFKEMNICYRRSSATSIRCVKKAVSNRPLQRIYNPELTYFSQAVTKKSERHRMSFKNLFLSSTVKIFPWLSHKKFQHLIGSGEDRKHKMERSDSEFPAHTSTRVIKVLRAAESTFAPYKRLLNLRHVESLLIDLISSWIFDDTSKNLRSIDDDFQLAVYIKFMWLQLAT